MSSPLNLIQFIVPNSHNGWASVGIMCKRFKESEIINLLQAIKVKISSGMGTEEACRSLGVSDKSYYRWRKLYGSTGHTKVKRCKDLEKENRQLRKTVADLELDKSILKEVLDFLDGNEAAA